MRENLSYIFFKELTGPGPLGALGAAGDAARHGRRRSQFRAARRAGVPRRSTAPRPTACGSRRIPAARSRAPTASTPSGARAPTAEAIAGGMSASGRALILLPKGAAARAQRSSADEAALWARVAATIRPLSREPVEPPISRRSRPQRRSAPAAPRGRVPPPRRSPRRRRAAHAPGGDARRRLGPAACGRARSSPTARSTFTAITSTAPGRRSTARSSGRSPPATASCC